MPGLSLPSIRLLVHACLEASIERDSLISGLPQQIVAQIPIGNSPAKQLFFTLNHLNNVRWADEASHPLRQALENALLFASGMAWEETFEQALGHLKEPDTQSITTKGKTFQTIFSRKMKAFYEGQCCRVIPGMEDLTGPFVVEHPDGRTSVVAVAYGEGDDRGTDVDLGISAVQSWLRTARYGGGDAEGYVVLAPKARSGDVERVVRAGLQAVDYEQCKPLSIEKMEAVVQHLLSELRHDPPWSFSVADSGEARSIEESLAAFFKEPRTRALILVGPRVTGVDVVAAELFAGSARYFVKHGPPAPLPMGAGWKKRRLLECASDLFNRCGVQVAPMALEPIAREGVVCPILVCDAPAPSPPLFGMSLVSRLLEGVSDQSKAIAVFGYGDAEAARRVETALASNRCKARLLRAVSAIEEA